MSRGTCWKCGHRTRFDGQVEGISRTICCETCCFDFAEAREHLYAGIHRLPDRRATQEYECTKEELSSLSSVILLYPQTGKEHRFFLGAEIKCLAEKRADREWKRRRKNKLQKLQIRNGINLEGIDPVLRIFLLGDYFCRWGKSSTTLHEIKERYKALPCVQSILRACPRTHPQAVFDFCVANPNAGPEAFDACRSKLQRVFQIEGDRIMRCLTKSERRRLLTTPLRDCVERFEGRDKCAMIRSWLEELVSDKKLAQEMTEHPACLLRIEREDDERRTALNLLQFWRERNDVEKRRPALAAACSRICSEKFRPYFALPQKLYVYGCIDVDPREVAGLLVLAAGRNFDFTSKDRFERVSIAVARFEACLHEKGMQYEEALAEAVDFGKKVPLPAVKNVRDTFDFKFLATGHWFDRWYKL